MFTASDGRYHFRELEQGEYWLLSRTDPQASYWTNRIQVNSQSVTVATLFLGELALGLGGEESAGKQRVRLVADANTLRLVKCVDYEVTVGNEKDRKSVCEKPFEYKVERAGVHYIYAGVRFVSGAYRGISRTVRSPAGLAATSRMINAAPCPSRVKLLSIAEEAEGIQVKLEGPISTSAGGTITPFTDTRTTVAYNPPAQKGGYGRDSLKEDQILYDILKDGTTAKAAISVRLLGALMPSCESSKK